MSAPLLAHGLDVADLAEVREALEAGADPNGSIDGRHPLMWALDALEEGAEVEILQLLLRAGAHPDGAGGPGATPLLAAVYRGLEEAAMQLLTAGASVCVCDDEGDTPLGVAAERGAVDLVRQLLEHGGMVCVERPSGAAGYTPLQWAVVRNDLRLVQLLLEAGADPAQRVGYGPSAQDLAVRTGVGTSAAIRALLQGT